MSATRRKWNLCSVLVAIAAVATVSCQVTIKRYPPTAEAETGPRDLGFLVEGAAINPQLLVLGAQVFDSRCQPCHGEQGKGDGPLADMLPIKPRNYHADLFKWGTRPSDIVRTIALGRSEIMPPFKDSISPNEMWAAAYLVWYWIPEERRSRDTAESLASWKMP